MKNPFEQNQERDFEKPLERGAKISQMENELSPEIIEKIMEKVQDINESETAAHSITQHGDRRFNGLSHRLATLKKNLQEGLLGTPLNKQEITKEKWVEYARKREGAFVFFNVVGRDIDYINESWWTAENRAQDPIVLIFNIARLQEDMSHDYVGYYDEPEKKFRSKFFGAHFRVGRDKKYLEIPKGSGKFIFVAPPPHSDNGYALTFRVAPRFLRGIVFRVDRERSEDELYKIWEQRQGKYKQGFDASIDEIKRGFRYVENDDEEVKIKRVDEIVLTMKESKTFLPVYDIHGNLFWPKKISYEEVKKFITLRDKQKEAN